MRAPYTLPVRVVDSGRDVGWRATLQSDDRSVWRCDCRPHASYADAIECGGKELAARWKRRKSRKPRAS